MKFSLTTEQLKKSESSLFSQGGQDGILEAIFNQIGYGNKYYVEFGARDGFDCSNTANLRLKHGWSGLLMDSESLSELVKQETITRDNINRVLGKYNVSEPDYLSIDIDGNEYWVWEAMEVEPRVMTIEYNSKFRNDESYAIEYNEDHKWEGDDYYAASLLALKKLGQRKGYSLVYVVDRFDAVFIRNSEISWGYHVPSLDELLPEPIIAHEKVSNKKWVEI